MVNALIESARTLIPFLAVVAVTLAALLIANRVLRRRWQDQPDAQFQFQLIMLSLTVAGALIVVASLPVSDTLRGQFLSLIGLLLSAAIALASTTFIGNIMAGVMLKVIQKARPGDFITVDELTGRITEMDLLHTEVQTEFRDLVTVPNSYMVTRPLKVVRASGSIITAEVSLGYDVPRDQVFQVLRDAAAESGLKDCFVHVRELGDFSITYRTAGLLEDISSLISARSRLLCAMLDALHGEGIEIVSPNHMATRAMDPAHRILPPSARPGSARAAENQALAEDIAFDKAEDAASAEKLRRMIAATEEEIAALDNRKSEGKSRSKSKSGNKAGQQEAAERLARQLERLQSLLKAAEEQIKADDSDATSA